MDRLADIPVDAPYVGAGPLYQWDAAAQAWVSAPRAWWTISGAVTYLDGAAIDRTDRPAIA